MVTFERAWSWFFERNPAVVAAWGHQNGRMPSHSSQCDPPTILVPVPPGWMHPDDACDCWCHLPEESQ